MRRYRRLSSVIAPVEVVSAIARRYRAGEVTRAHFDAIVARMQSDRQYWNLVELGAGVLEGAERLILQTPIRTLDALHISSALLLQMESATPLPFATADARQRQAAGHAGQKVVWVTRGYRRTCKSGDALVFVQNRGNRGGEAGENFGTVDGIDQASIDKER
jgi:predicted nucleic acid-binding protein